MTPDELYEQKSIAVEKYAYGYLLADYSGKRGEASYCGKSMEWRRVPVVQPGDTFDSIEEAVAAGEGA